MEFKNYIKESVLYGIQFQILWQYKSNMQNEDIDEFWRGHFAIFIDIFLTEICFGIILCFLSGIFGLIFDKVSV